MAKTWFLLAAAMTVTGCEAKNASVPSSPPRPSAQGMSVGAVLENVQRVYRDARSYSDTGKADSEIVERDGNRRQAWPAISFSTAFERPSRIRFDFHSSGDDSRRASAIAIHSSGAGTYVVDDTRKTKTNKDSLVFALAENAGLSDGLSATIPALLTNSDDDLYGPWLAKSAASIPSVETIDGTPCYRLDLTRERTDSEIVWIDRETFLVRQIRVTSTLPDQSRLETTMHYQPRRNPSLDDKVFDD